MKQNTGAIAGAVAGTVLALLVTWLGLNEWRFPWVVSDAGKTLVPASDPVAPTPTSEAQGRFSGVAVQSSATRTKHWQVDVIFSGPDASISYALPGQSVACSGTLTKEATGVWIERIQVGHCDSLGTWSFTPLGSDALRGEYQAPKAAQYSVTVDLTRP